jgi:hypothetical protein
MSIKTTLHDEIIAALSQLQAENERLKAALTLLPEDEASFPNDSGVAVVREERYWQLRAAEEENAALKADAERYRFIRSQTSPVGILIHGIEEGFALESMDKAIDEEMADWAAAPKDLKVDESPNLHKPDSSAVYVCPERDIECGNRESAWCMACPKRQWSATPKVEG